MQFNFLDLISVYIGVFMNFLVLLSGISTVILSLVLGILVLFLGFSFFSKLSIAIDEEEELQKNNIAVAILSASLIFSLGYMMKSSIYPLIQAFFNILFYSDEGVVSSLVGFGFLLLQFLLTLVISMGSLWVGLKAFTWLTKNLDEFEEIRNNNIAVAILMSAIIITLALFLREGLERLLQTLQMSHGLNNSSLTPFG